jgi:hypothetical protein
MLSLAAAATIFILETSSSTPVASLHALASLHFSLCWLGGVSALLAVCGREATTSDDIKCG